jgi:hypothetical protein
MAKEAIFEEACKFKAIFEGVVILHVLVCEKQIHKLSIASFCYNISCLAMVLHGFTYLRALFTISLLRR